MSEPTATQPKPITFEDGYRRLQAIADEVNQTEVPVDRMADLFAEGKGLDKALTDHLANEKGRIDRIERGEEIQAFQIVAPGAQADTEPAAPAPTATARDVPANTGDFAPAEPSSSGGAADDDIPF